jgi:hypothetical protein
MVSIDYRKDRVLGLAALFALGLMFMLWMIADPGVGRYGRFGRAMDSGFGQMVLIPLLGFAFAAGVIKMLLIAAGPASAVEFADDGMIVHTGWGTKKVPWSNFARAEVSSYRAGWTNVKQLTIRRTRGGKLRVSLGITNVGARPEAALEVIELMQTRAFALGHRVSPSLEADLGGPPPTPAPAPVEPAFDADAALARYLEKKKRGLIEAPGPAAPVRQGFGRKGL